MDDRHGQDDVAVFAPDVDIPQNVVRYVPYEAPDVQGAHCLPSAAALWLRLMLSSPGFSCSYRLP